MHDGDIKKNKPIDVIQQQMLMKQIIQIIVQYFTIAKLIYTP